jgi:nitrate reductase NapE component/MFS family permease
MLRCLQAVLVFVIVAVAGAQPLETQASRMALLRQVPQTAPERAAHIQLAEERLSELTPTTQPATQPTEEGAVKQLEARHALFTAWQRYLAQLQRPAAVDESLAQLQDPARVESVAAEVARLEREAQALRQKRLPREIEPDDLQNLRSELQKLEPEIASLAAAQADRAALLAGGYDKRQETLQGELKEARAALQAQRQEGVVSEDAASPSEDPTRQLQQERLEVQIARLELALQMLGKERQLTELLSRRDERRLAALRAKQAAVQERLAALTAAAGKDRIAILERERAQASRPVDVAVAELELFVERVLLRYFAPAETASGEGAAVNLPRVREQLAQSKGTWERIEATREHLRGFTLRELQWELRQQQRSMRTMLTQVQTRQQALTEQIQKLQLARERAEQRYLALLAKVEEAATGLSATDRAEVEKRLAAIRARSSDTMRAQLAARTERVDQLDAVATELETHLETLATLGQNLYWAQLGTRDSGLLRTNWPEVGRELSATWTALTSADANQPVAPQAADEVALLSEQRDTRRAARDLMQAARATFSRVRLVHGIWAIVSVVIAGGLGYVVRYFSRVRGRRLAAQIVAAEQRHVEDPRTPRAGVDARVNLLLLNLVGDLAGPLLASGALCIVAGQLIDDVLVQREVWLIVGALAGTLTLMRLVHHLFEHEHKIHRPLPCSDPVARHYRWWLSVAIIVSLVLLLPYVLLWLGGISLVLQAALAEIYKAVVLVMLLAFLLRKQRVVGPLATRGQHWHTVLASIFYPVIFLVVLSLLVLEVVGYGALVTYIGQSLVLSALTLIGLIVTAGYIVDALERYAAEQREAAEQVVAEELEQTDGQASVDLEKPAQRNAHYVLLLMKGLVRTLAAFAVVAGLLWVWNVPIPEVWWNWRFAGLGALVLALALVVDRVIVAAMFALHRSGRLPESTTDLIRRWLRGALFVVTGLLLVAVGGWQISGLWTFLTTLLAMIAIGFVAVWSILSNLLATIVILIWRPFNIGDRIEVLPEALEGQVVDLSFMYTVLRADDGSKLAIPNNFFAQKFIRRRRAARVVRRTLAEQLQEEKAIDE